MKGGSRVGEGGSRLSRELPESLPQATCLTAQVQAQVPASPGAAAWSSVRGALLLRRPLVVR